MNQEIAVLVATPLLFGLLLLLCRRCRPRYQVTFYIICLYAFSSVMSIVFYFQPLANLNGNITWWPMIYWFSLFGITLFPIWQFDTSHVCHFKYDVKLLDKMVRWGALLSAIPFWEQMTMIPSLVMGGESDLGETMVDLHNNGVLDEMSFVGRNLLRLNIAIYDLTFIILFIQFIRERKNKVVILSCFFIIITRNLTGILAGHRSAAIGVLFKVILIIVIVYPLIGRSQKKLLKKSLLGIISVVGAVFIVITVGRQMAYSVTYGEDFTMTYFLSRYAGEGLINFNQFLPQMKHYTDGLYTSWTLLQMLGMNPHELDYDYMYGYLESFTGIPQNIFYTYIGSFVHDFGFLIGALLLMMMSLFFSLLMREYSSVMPISKLFLVVFYASIILEGVTSFPYCGEGGKFFIWSFVVYFVLRLLKM